MKEVFSFLAAGILAAFGFLALFLSISVIFDLFDFRSQEGNYVLFIGWINFISSLFYLFAAYGFIEGKKWTANLMGISSVMIILAFLGLLFHINSGCIYGNKVIGVMTFRIIVSIALTIFAHYSINEYSKLESHKEQ